MIKNSIYHWNHICCCSVTRLCLTLCDPMNCSAPGSYGPLLSPRVCSNLCSLNRWCYWIISSSGASSSFWLWSFPVSGSFPMSKLFTPLELNSICCLWNYIKKGFFPFKYFIHGRVKQNMWMVFPNQHDKTWSFIWHLQHRWYFKIHLNYLVIMLILIVLFCY